MPEHILNNIFIDFLNCEYKAYLKLEGKFGQKSEYEKLHGHLSQEYRIHACKNYSSLISENKISATEIPISELLKKRLDVGINIKTEINGFNLFFDTVILNSSCKLEYIPIIIAVPLTYK